MHRWKLIGVIATALIVLVMPLAVWKFHSRVAAPQARSAADFVGSETCKACHQPEYELWKGSNHYHAMEVATEASVRGDFNDASFEHAGVVSRFYRKDGKYFVHTQGPEGRMGDFEVTHTFGWNPLQQYLIPFPGGRMQCLPIAWDVKAKRWYHLYPNQAIDPKDWLYWTNAAQNWNGMCADVPFHQPQEELQRPDRHLPDHLVGHQRRLRGLPRPRLEACEVGRAARHGPADGAELRASGAHLRAEVARSRGTLRAVPFPPGDPGGLHPHRARPAGHHAAEPAHPGPVFPRRADPGRGVCVRLVHPEQDVRAGCALQRLPQRPQHQAAKEGNGLCLQCHRAADYDTRQHHFHKQKGEKGDPIKSADGRVLFEVGTGAECIECHMPGRYYMGVHYRLDHSIRIPRPDLSIKLGVPDACTRCHMDKTNRWSDETITKWYGPGRRAHYGEIIQAGRNRQPGAAAGLIRLAEDPLYPVIVRATALELLAAYPGEAGSAALRAGADGRRSADPPHGRKPFAGRPTRNATSVCSRRCFMTRSRPCAPRPQPGWRGRRAVCSRTTNAACSSRRSKSISPPWSIPGISPSAVSTWATFTSPSASRNKPSTASRRPSKSTTCPTRPR